MAAAAIAKKDLDNAELALKRVRSDLATQVRNAYFALLVSEETVRINLALARFTDDVYLLQIKMMEPGFAAPYEPAALRAQAFTVRLSLYQSIQNYNYSWKQLVAVIGERQMPLSQVAGRIDSMIPYYDYDTVLAHVLKEHTDVLTARNGIDIAKANLKLQQVTPDPGCGRQCGRLSRSSLRHPEQITQTVSVTVPIPIWDQNKGNILSAESALVRASEEPHRVELTLTNSLANAYNNYKNNLDALEYYRRYILPDLVRTYQSVYQRRGIDQGVVFGDIVTAQQTLVSSISTYLTILGQLWTSVVGVADFLQTDNLFQNGQPIGLPPLPDFDQIPGWPCCHPPCGTWDQGRAAPPGAPVQNGAVNPGTTLSAPPPMSPGAAVKPGANGSAPPAFLPPVPAAATTAQPAAFPMRSSGAGPTGASSSTGAAPPPTTLPYSMPSPARSPRDPPPLMAWKPPPNSTCRSHPLCRNRLRVPLDVLMTSAPD